MTRHRSIKEIDWKRDAAITRACADAMGIIPPQDVVKGVNYDYALTHMGYSPLRNDDQAMALVKKFRLSITWGNMHENGHWYVSADGFTHAEHDRELNRAICGCVAQMQASK